MLYQIRYRKEALQQLSKIPRNIRDAILRAVRERLTVAPERFKPLQGCLDGFYRLRVGSYRVVYKIHRKVVLVVVVRVDVRGSVYR